MKKTHKKRSSKKHLPSLVLAAFAVLIPVLAAGVAPLFAEEVADAPQKLFDFSIFDGEEFLRSRRERHSAAEEMFVPAADDTAAPAATVSPCDPTPVPVSEPATVEVLSISDLTLSERETLRGQLRNRACPQKADAAYLELCQRLLNALPAVETMTGLTNPNQ